MKSKIFFGLLILLSACLDDVPVSPTEQIQSDVAKINAYLEENPPAPTDIVIKDASGVTVVITQQGTGIVPPDQENEIVVSYTGHLLSGEVFDTRPEDDPLYLVMAHVSIISGWKIALGMMTEGTIATVYIPSYYAYGKTGKGDIPGNTVLVFDMNLLAVDLSPKQQSQMVLQLSAISAALEGNTEAQVLESGISIIHTQVGTGATPGPYDVVSIKYSGRLLSDEDVEFLPETTRGPTPDFSSRSINYLHGLNLAFQQMQEGGRATVYIPALLAYGPHSGPGVGPNANLIYDIELLAVNPQ